MKNYLENPANSIERRNLYPCSIEDIRRLPLARFNDTTRALGQWEKEWLRLGQGRAVELAPRMIADASPATTKLLSEIMIRWKLSRSEP